MSIEKTVFTKTHTNYTEATSEMISWFQNNAADYFDTFYTSSDDFSCVINNVEVLKFTPSSGGRDMFKVCSGAGFAAGTSSTFYYPEVYKTDNGIVLFRKDGSDNLAGSLFITKSTSGDPLAVAAVGRSSGISDWVYFVMDFKNGDQLLKYWIKDSDIATYENLRKGACIQTGVTVLCPLIFGTLGNYSNGLYYAPFNQNPYTAGSIIELNGKKYVFDGLIALEE